MSDQFTGQGIRVRSYEMLARDNLRLQKLLERAETVAPIGTASCASCRFFDGVSRMEGAYGHCLRRCPIVWKGEAAWPVVQTTNWCGEYRAREDAA